ncbi:hypothetical protein RDWZM_006170 [Blomia tropicalis]|uniref:Uncharacterized protein n=1 Tax=Blomia tropicalis TaxID=40697 RepID=A0A9Q0RLI2_BLOTA|nr:hypothetical protein RDWZM_006170 [Blomia tropicalis]
MKRSKKTNDIDSAAAVADDVNNGNLQLGYHTLHDSNHISTSHDGDDEPVNISIHYNLNGSESVSNSIDHHATRPESVTASTTPTTNTNTNVDNRSMISTDLSRLPMVRDDQPYGNRSRPSPIKLGKTSTNYCRLQPPPSPLSCSHSIATENASTSESNTINHGTGLRSIPNSISANSLTQTTNPTITTSGPSDNVTPNPTTYVPILISTKDLEAAFLNDLPPPSMYTIPLNQPLETNGTNVQSYVHGHDQSSAVKRTKSFQERINHVFWRTGTGTITPPTALDVKRKAPVSARMSILGKPLPPSRTKQLMFHQERSLVYNFLQRPKGYLAYSYHALVACIVILGLMFYAFSTVPDLEWWAIIVLRVFDILILSILTIEFIALFWSSSCISKYQGWRGSIRFLFSPFRLLDLLIIGICAVVLWTHWLPPNKSYLLWLRCGQVFQILRLENRFKPWRLLSSVLWLQRKHLLITTYMALLILVLISYVVYFLEQSDPDTTFTTIPNSLYWGIITVCTIGYGDMAPKTTAGRTVGGILAIFGAIVYAIPAGVIATGLALKVQESNRQKHINKRKLPAARLIQCAWRCYAASRNSRSVATWAQHLKPFGTKGRKLGNVYNSLDHFGSKANVQCSRFNLIEEYDCTNSNRTSHNDLTVHNRELLTAPMKNCVRFIRAVKYNLARKEFKNAFRPYDIKDVMQQYSEGHADVVGRVRHMQTRINNVQAGLSGVMKLVHETQFSQAEKIDRLERTIHLLLNRLSAQNSNLCCHGRHNDHHHQNQRHHHHHLTSPNIYSDNDHSRSSSQSCDEMVTFDANQSSCSTINSNRMRN